MLGISVFTSAGAEHPLDVPHHIGDVFQDSAPTFVQAYVGIGHRPFDTVIKIKFSLDRCFVR